MTVTGEDAFCQRCDLRLSLHPEESDWGCEIAGEKYSLIAAFGRTFLPQHADASGVVFGGDAA